LHQGTTFRIKLPLTLAIITGLLMKISGQTYVMPMNQVTEIVRVHRDEISTLNHQEVIMNRGQVIPVVWLHELFCVPRSEQAKKFTHLVIIGLAEKRLALAVDDLLGNQEVVIKSLGQFVGKTEWFSGSTILGDGKVSLIVNPASIFHAMKK